MQRKRSNSDTSSQTNRPTKHPQLASQSSHSCLTPLNSIMEEDESLADTLVSDFDITGFPKYGHTAQLIGKAQFINALTGSDDDEVVERSESSDVEDLVEEVDTEILSGDGSSKDEDLSLSKPATHPHLRTMKSMKTQSHESTSTKPCTKHE
jgi:hypothetical protein